MSTPTLAEPAVKRVTYLDPTGHVQVVERQNARRLASVKGTTAALLDNGNDTSRFFFEALANILRDEFGVAQVILKTKFISSKPADEGMLAEMGPGRRFHGCWGSPLRLLQLRAVCSTEFALKKPENPPW